MCCDTRYADKRRGRKKPGWASTESIKDCLIPVDQSFFLLASRLWRIGWRHQSFANEFDGSFPDVEACSGICLRVERGEVDVRTDLVRLAVTLHTVSAQ